MPTSWGYCEDTMKWSLHKLPFALVIKPQYMLPRVADFFLLQNKDRFYHFTPLLIYARFILYPIDKGILISHRNVETVLWPWSLNMSIPSVSDTRVNNSSSSVPRLLRMEVPSLLILSNKKLSCQTEHFKVSGRIKINPRGLGNHSHLLVTWSLSNELSGSALHGELNLFQLLIFFTL